MDAVSGGRRSFVFSSGIFLWMLAALFVAAFALRGAETWEAVFQAGASALKGGRYPEARVMLVRAYQQASAFPSADLRRPAAGYALSMLYSAVGESARAEPLLQAAHDLLASQGPQGHAALALTLDALGAIRMEQTRWSEAEDLFRRALEMNRGARGEQNPLTAINLRHLGETLAARGQLAEGEASIERSLALLRTARQPAPAPMAASLASLGQVRMLKGDYTNAEPLLRQALDLNRELGESHPLYADSLLALGSLYRSEGQAARAEPLFRKAAKIYEAANDPHLGGALSGLALLAADEHKFATAEQLMTRALAILEAAFGASHVAVAVARADLADIYFGDRQSLPQVVSQVARMRRSPSAKSAGGVSRLSTRNASRSKS